MAAHARSKNEFMEDEKSHSLMTRLILLNCAFRLCVAVKIQKSDRFFFGNILKFRHSVLPVVCPNDANRMANNVEPNQMAGAAV